MNRRHFIIEAGKAFPIVAGAVYLVGCDSANDNGDNTNNDKNTGNQSLTLTVQSTTNAGHSHSAQIPLSDLNLTTNKTYNTSNSSGHFHIVTLSASELTTLKNGGSVTKSSTNNSGHAHQFTFQVGSGIEDNTGGGLY